MISRLSGILPASDIDNVRESSNIIFQDSAKRYAAKESYLLYDQNLLKEDVILKLASEETGVELVAPEVDYVHLDILKHYQGHNVVPYKFDTMTDTIYLGVLPEDMQEYIQPYKNKNVVKVPVPMYWFVHYYTKAYSRPKFLAKMPAKVLFNLIVKEAIDLGAADITITQRATTSEVFYNVRKRLVKSRRSVDKTEVDEIVKFILACANRLPATTYKEPIYFSNNLDQHHRGRVVVTKNYYGYKAVIRVLPNSLFNTTLEQLNLKDTTVNFIRKHVLDFGDKGLRVFVGPTFSGKNTTIASTMQEMNGDFRYSGVSVEQPVELLMDFVDQHDTETDEEYEATVNSLIRQNPDFVYVTEITDRTAIPILGVANTGKVVFTSVHANTLSDVPARLQDLTGYSLDRVILNLQTLIYQELVRNEEEDKIYPRTRCIHISDEIRQEMFGKSLGEVQVILSKLERSWA